MKADVFEQVSKQNANTGKIERLWQFQDTIECMARGLGNLRGKDFGTADSWKELYRKEDFLRIKTMYHVTDTMRVTNVRDANGEIPWLEDSDSGTPTVFDVVGVTPVIEPFGTHLEYDVFLDRSEVQTLDLWTP
jgi:hypothetical protein